jgi:hypothetical protein
MPGFFFLNANFLFGMFAVAVPVLIHLFTRRRAKRLEFSSVTFLRDIARRETRRLKVRNLLLLLLRMGAIAALVLAMARPALRGPLARGQGSASVVVVLDNSASMGALRQGRPLFSYASDLARQVFERLGEGDEGTVLPVCDVSAGGGRDSDTSRDAPGIAQLQSLVSGPARLAGMVGLVQLTNRDTKPDAAIALAYALLQKSKNIHKDLYVISDFQASQWGDLRAISGKDGVSSHGGVGSQDAKQGASGDGGARSRDARRRASTDAGLKDLRVRTVLVPVSAGSPANLFACDAQVVRSGTALKRGVEFTVVNSGRSFARGARVELRKEGKEEAVRYIDLAPSDSVRVGVEISGAVREITISLPPDSLPADDDHYVAVGAEKRVNVLVLSDETARPSPDYLSVAMSVSAEFVPQRVPVADLNEQALSSAQCVILDNVGKLAARQLDLLAAYKKSGGKLLLALGDRVDFRYYNDMLLPALFPARLVGVEGAGDRERAFFTLRAAIANHPVLARFNVSRNEPVSGARFFEVVTVEPLEGSTVIAQFAEGVPALLERDGAILFASSLEPGWNELATSGAFVPLLHEMLGYLCGVSGGAGKDVRPGEVFTEELPQGPLSAGPFEQPGVYTLGAGGGRTVEFSVNISPEESLLEFLPRNRLRTVIEGASVIDLESAVETWELERSGQELWPAFALLAMAFLVAELFVARSAAPPE